MRFLASIFPLLGVALLASTAALAEQSTASISAMNAMKHKVDIIGIKLGDSAEKAKALVQSSIADAQFSEYVDDETDEVVGWVAHAGECLSAATIRCSEVVNIRHVDDRIWFISRTRNYNIDESKDVPTIIVARKALDEKYGPLMEYDRSYSHISASGSFARDSNMEAPHSSCGNHQRGDVPSNFSPDMSWVYDFGAVADGPNDAYLSTLKAVLIDCSFMFDTINESEAAEAAAQAEQHRRDLEKAIKPAL